MLEYFLSLGCALFQSGNIDRQTWLHWLVRQLGDPQHPATLFIAPLLLEHAEAFAAAREAGRRLVERCAAVLQAMQTRPASPAATRLQTILWSLVQALLLRNPHILVGRWDDQLLMNATLVSAQ